MLTVPDIRQRQDYDCGSAAVDAVARFWGLSAGGTGKLANPVQGMNPDTVEAVFRAIGLHVLSGQMTLPILRDLARSGVPVLCPVTVETDAGPAGHWVVVRGVAYRKVWFHCPTTGPASLAVAAWSDRWHDSHRTGRYDRWGIAAHRG